LLGEVTADGVGRGAFGLMLGGWLKQLFQLDAGLCRMNRISTAC